MAKKILLGMMAFATLFATSCTNELAPIESGNTSTVSFKVGTPEIQSRAYSDGKTAKVLQYAVYSVDKTGALTMLEDLDGTKEFELKTTVDFSLTTGNKYAVIFWAGAKETPYSVDFAEKKMTVNYAAAVSNDENRDAFYKYQEFTVKGAMDVTVELKRPFSQLNIGTNDYAASTSAGYTPKFSYVKVPVSSELNLVTGEVNEAADVEFKLAAIPQDETFPVANYEYLAMNYLLVPAEKEVVDLTFGYSENNTTVEKTRTVGSVPVQRNYRTNIYGQLLTSDVDINVEINPDYEKPAHEVEALYLAAAVGGEVTLTEDVELTAPLNVQTNMKLNLNGKTLTGSINVAKDAALTVDGGSLVNTDNTVSGITSNGNLTLNNVAIKSARHAVRVESGEVVINGGTYEVAPINASTLHALNVGDENTVANVIIKGGTFIGPKGTMADSGSAVNVRSGSSVTIEGGNFSGGKNNTLSAAGTLEVKGGTFDQDPSKYVAEGCYALQYEAGKYTVQAIDAASRTLTINSKEDLLKLNTLNEKWVEFFSDGQGTSYTNYANGKGTDFYYKWTWTIKLNADIDFEGAILDAAVANLEGFGWFDGQNHTIKNVTIKNTSDAGLFNADHCGLKNIVLDNVKVEGGNDSSVGILTSNCHKSIDNITITNSSVEGGKYTGSVVGYGYCDVTNCTITNCSVKGNYKFGGVIGYICASNSEGVVNGNTLTNCTVAWTGNYTPGKSNYVMGKIVGNYNCNGACENNIVAGMTTTATANIGKIEAGMTVTDKNIAGVATAADWKALSTKAFTGNNGKAEEYTIALLNDIDMQGTEFSAIIAQRGDKLTILGNGHTISNVKVISGANDNTTGQASMFYAYPNSTLNVSDLTLKDITVIADKNATGYASALVGFCEGTAILNNVDVVNATITGVKSSGMLAGHLSGNLTAADCDLSGTITLDNFTEEPNGHYAGKYFGTLAGTATVKNCTVNVTVSGNLNAANIGNEYGRKTAAGSLNE